MIFTCDYMRDDVLRHKLNDLTRKIFCFDFEDWVTNGYYEGDYIPYSFLEKDRMISNVSANKMCFMQNGIEKNYIQIGTVMTDPEYRKQGLAGKLLQKVVHEYEDRCDGFYLFANLNALHFYRELGFQELREYRYTLNKDNPEWLKNSDQNQKNQQNTSSITMFTLVNPTDMCMKQKYMDTVRNSAVNAALDQVNRFGLQMFYTADMNDVYYAKDIDCFLLMINENDTLTLESIICKKHISLKDILTRVQTECDTIQLGFAPCREDRNLFRAVPYDGGEDYRLLYKGEALRSIETEKLLFPLYSHA